jgi:hypothetical protein
MLNVLAMIDTEVPKQPACRRCAGALALGPIVADFERLLFSSPQIHTICRRNPDHSRLDEDIIQLVIISNADSH